MLESHHYKTKGEIAMLKWLCYDEDTVFYVNAATREEAQNFAELHGGHVVCAVQPASADNVEQDDKRQH